MPRQDATFDDGHAPVASPAGWTGPLLALVGYLVFHFSVDMLPPPLARAAALLQYLFPLSCLAATLALSRLRRRHARLDDATALDVLDHICSSEFELLLAEAFRRRGYAVCTRRSRQSGSAVDLALDRGREQYFVQWRQWRAERVGIDAVRELYGAMVAEGAAGGFVVTAGRFGDDARRFAQGHEMKLIDGPALLRMIRGIEIETRQMALRKPA
ncbi:restriction endonuclease [Chitinimonas koreensis]|uniref:restriction endonuclease n=1 Tax=Chitinimonas koreensis TaxID=356302 RepID=UPI000408B0D1|nr:restriction endonuclease [Chitinimonas koreensis]QNM97429.1 restriction endonuclease [Chitinimonas koreensis]